MLVLFLSVLSSENDKLQLVEFQLLGDGRSKDKQIQSKLNCLVEGKRAIPSRGWTSLRIIGFISVIREDGE